MISDDTISCGSQDFYDGCESMTSNEELFNPPKEMKPSVKKALLHFRCKLQDAILGNYIYGRAPSTDGEIKLPNENLHAREDIRDISLWGVPLLPSKGHEGTDIILLKFLRAKDYKVNDAYEMLGSTLKWRRDFGIDKILEEEVLPDLQSAGYVDSTDRNSNPVVYMIYGAFKDKTLYGNTFGTEEKCREFLRWKAQLMEKSVQKLRFKEGRVASVLQVTDLRNLQSPGTKELRATSKKAYTMLHENYPEIISKTIFVNVPFWFYAYHSMFTRLLPQRAKNKFIFARPSSVTKTLLKFIAAENLPVRYGGLKRENDDEFSSENEVLETIVNPGCIDSIEVPVIEPGVTVVWDLMVVGLDVSYREEFIPDDDCSYRILIRKENKLSGSVRNSFYINEPGKIILTMDNSTFKKKKVLYRLKIKPTVPMYIKLH